jgi:hypothetical protein
MGLEGEHGTRRVQKGDSRQLQCKDRGHRFD